MLQNLDTPYGEALALHHGSTDGWFTTLSKDEKARGGIRQDFYRLNQLEEVAAAARRAPDTYISQNSFAGKVRRVSYLRTINCSWVDVDCYNQNLAADESTMNTILAASRAVGIPDPSYVVASGRGLYLKWLFTTPLNAVDLHIWEATQNALTALFAALGADSKSRDGARVLRFMGSVNSRVETGDNEVRLMWSSGKRHDFSALLAAVRNLKVDDVAYVGDSTDKIAPLRRGIKRLDDELAPQEREALAERQRRHFEFYSQGRAPILLQRGTLRSLYWSRFLDLRDLFAMRGGAFKGSRDMALFWMGLCLSQSGVVTPQNFFDEMRELAGGFPGTGVDFKPLEDGSLGTLFEKLKAAHGEWCKPYAERDHRYRPLYTPRNDKLIDLFEITEEEQRELRTIISKGEKQRRAEEKLTPEQVARRERRLTWRAQATQMAASAAAEGLTPCVTQIALAVGVHKSEVSRLLSGKLGGARKGCLPRGSSKSSARRHSPTGHPAARRATPWPPAGAQQAPAKHHVVLNRFGRIAFPQEIVRALQAIKRHERSGDVAQSITRPRADRFERKPTATSNFSPPVFGPLLKNQTQKGSSSSPPTVGNSAFSRMRGGIRGVPSGSWIEQGSGRLHPASIADAPANAAVNLMALPSNGASATPAERAHDAAPPNRGAFSHLSRRSGRAASPTVAASSVSISHDAESLRQAARDLNAFARASRSESRRRTLRVQAQSEAAVAKDRLLVLERMHGMLAKGGQLERAAAMQLEIKALKSRITELEASA